ncbi:hypothetical protein PR202_gb05805 [Eleusine coracana subsp. coracana]|uniref:Uncharacterized protein n=1 Tax=Eleusine coracana subsp. coracana TaxID=191504 RepID=A0AAV5E5G6_ELECO|nr:hypothetical protein PR202_gb05805 [Eleusine coracana subsp. coracana]
MPKNKRKGINTLIILTTWFLWKHRNSCVFEGSNPSIAALLHHLNEEHHLWCLARARGLRRIGLGHVEDLG